MGKITFFSVSASILQLQRHPPKHTINCPTDTLPDLQADIYQITERRGDIKTDPQSVDRCSIEPYIAHKALL